MSISLPYTLPSQGRLYGDLFPGGEVTILPIRGAQEELLAGSGKANVLVVLQHLTQQLTQLPAGFNFPDLLVTDWFALLINIFSFSYSSRIQMQPVCPKCGHKFLQDTDLSQLQCVHAADRIEQFGTYEEPFDLPPLPRSGEKIQCRLLRLRDMVRIEDYRNQRKNKGGLADSTLTYSMALHIHSINGNVNMEDLEIMRWVRNAFGQDLRFIRSELEARETGYELRPEFTCPECSSLFAIELPLDFFRSMGSQT